MTLTSSRACAVVTAALEGMMATSAVRRSSCWITVLVSSGHRCAAGTVVSGGHGGIRSVSTMGAEKLWRGAKLSCGEPGKALTLRGLSGECEQWPVQGH